jgi:hypothetical protein
MLVVGSGYWLLEKWRSSFSRNRAVVSAATRRVWWLLCSISTGERAARGELRNGGVMVGFILFLVEVSFDFYG